MSENFYTTTTAALKATKADIRLIDAKQIKLNGEPIPSKVLDDRGEFVTDQDLWGTSVTTDENGVVHVSHEFLSNPNGTSAWNSSVKSVKDNKAYTSTDATGEPLCNIQTEMIKDGSYMFYSTSLESFSGDLSSLVNGSVMFMNTSLTSFSGDLSSLVNGFYMFYETSLTSFSGDLSSLVNGSNMFRNTSLESFSGDLSSLVNGSSAFHNTSLTSFSGDLSSLVNGSSMFYNTSLTSFSGDLSSLVNGSSMFRNTSLASFSGDLSGLVNGSNMFSSTSLESFSGDLSGLVNGSYMFSSTSLESFSGDLSGLVNGSYMFYNTSLTSFSDDLSSLVGGSNMFRNTSLASFSGDLSNLVEGSNMFSSTSLASFSGDLSSLVNGNSMFKSTSLTSFSGDLSNLVGGPGMFSNCKLTHQSVMCIVESIRNLTEEKAKYTSGEIPWVIKDSTTQKYSAPFGFMEDGKYVFTYNIPNPFTTTISSSYVGQLTLGIDVTNDSDTIEQQLQTFAEGCLCDSWAELKQEFADKGWTVTFQYGGTNSSITLSEDEQFRGVPVYARLIEVSEEDKDKAKYCTEDGTKFYNINWGHDVTDYDQYQYFGSLLEACGYFGVIPVKYLEES